MTVRKIEHTTPGKMTVMLVFYFCCRDRRSIQALQQVSCEECSKFGRAMTCGSLAANSIELPWHDAVDRAYSTCHEGEKHPSLAYYLKSDLTGDALRCVAEVADTVAKLNRALLDLKGLWYGLRRAILGVICLRCLGRRINVAEETEVYIDIELRYGMDSPASRRFARRPDPRWRSPIGKNRPEDLDSKDARRPVWLRNYRAWLRRAQYKGGC
jgi:hypothetical protein